MTVSLRTLCRMALAAAGLALAAPALAGTATIDCGSGSPSWNSSTNTLSCGGGSKCTISGPSSVIVNTLFTLNASCPSGSTFTWTGTGGASSCTGASCDVTEISTGNKTYTVATETAGTLSNSFVVSITSGAVAPSGCSLVANPTSGPSGTNVGLTASCTSGTSPINITWGGASGTGACPTSFNVGTPATCTVSNVTVNATWTASFSNAGGNFANNPRSAAFAVQSGGGGSFAGCPSGSVLIDGQWGNLAISIADWGGFANNIVSVRMAVPSNWAGGVKLTSWDAFIDGGVPREATLSTAACDFSDTNALKNGGWPAHIFTNSGFSFSYKSPTATGSAYVVNPGGVYYVNIRNKKSTGQDSCTSGGTCNMRGSLPN